MEVLHAAKIHERGGQEAAQADVEDKAALDDLDDLALDVLAGLELLLDAAPSALVLSTLLGQHETAVRALLGHNKSLDGIAHRNDVCGVSVLADGQLADRNDALGLEADVDQDLVLVDLRHGAAHEIALVEVGNGTVDEIVHLLIIHVV